MPADGRKPERRDRDLRTAVLLGLLCFLVYNANLRSIAAGDTVSTRFLPFEICRHGSVLLDPIYTAAAQGHPHPFWIFQARGGHAVSGYPVVLPVLVAPLYLPVVGYLQLRGWTDERRLDFVSRIMEKLTASLLAAVSAALLYLLLRRRAAPYPALLLAIAFACGTTTWVISSQALWQHGLAELLVIGTLLLLTGPPTASRALAAGLLCGLMAGNRPPDAILAVALGLYALGWAGRRRAPLLAAGAVLALAPVLIYNLREFGALGGSYGLLPAIFFQHGLLSGLAGLLFSPAKGLFIFSPFLLFLPFGFRHALRDRGARGLTLVLCVAVLLQLLVYAKTDWRAGYSWGPRFLTDLLPLLLWMLAPVVEALPYAGRVAFALATAVAIVIEAVGAFWYAGASDIALFAGDRGPNPLAAAWNFQNAPFLAELRHAPAPRELFLGVRGSLDRVTAENRDVDVNEVIAGTPLVAQGWALADGRSPGRVMVFLADQALGVTTTWFDRSDVRTALHQTSPAGWRVLLRTDSVPPGEHILSVTVQVNENGVFHPLAQRPFTVLARRNPSWPGYEPPPTAPAPALAGSTVKAEVPKVPALDFYTLPPCRLLDTRGPTGLSGGPILTAGTPRNVPVVGGCGIPADARSLSLNITVTDPTSDGYVALYPGDAGASISRLYFNATQTRAKNAILALARNGDGSLWVRASPFRVGGNPGQVHMILDVNGYFRERSQRTGPRGDAHPRSPSPLR